eukprot:1161915-Pelagomonas_calceolata.AAC.13
MVLMPSDMLVPVQSIHVVWLIGLWLSLPAKNKSISSDTKKRKALYFANEGIEKQDENSLDAAKKVASQKNPGSKVQRGRDTCGAKTNVYISTIKKHMFFILSSIARTPVTHRGSILPVMTRVCCA